VPTVLVGVASNPFVAIGLLLVGLISAVGAMGRQGVDAQWPFIYAYGVWHGEPIFSATWRDVNLPMLTGMHSDFGSFWPAAMGTVMLPLAALSFDVARTVQLLLFVGALVTAVWVLFGLARPKAPWTIRLSVAALVLLSACARWCWTPVQLGPLLAALLVATLAGVRRDRPWLSYLATTLVIALKPTVVLPFILLLVLHRKYKTLLLAFGTNVVLNVIAFARLGGFHALGDYRRGTSTLERLGGINTPNFWERVSIPRVDWTYLLTGLTGSLGLGRVLALLGGGALAAFLFLACLRLSQPPSMADSCRIMLAGTCVGLVIVYHHHYELVMLIPPLLLAAMLHRELDLTWSRWTTWSFMPITLIMLLVPASLGTNTFYSLLGQNGPGVFNLTFPVATTLALFGSLIMVIASMNSSDDWVASAAEGRAGSGEPGAQVPTAG
jgi:Glycosyltransferase family 87